MKGATNMEVRVNNKVSDCENLTKERASINFTAEEIGLRMTKLRE